MIIRKSFSNKAFDFINACVLVLLMVLTLYPFIHILFASVSNAVELTSHTGILLRPYGFDLSAYDAVFKNKLIWSGYANTVLYLVVGTTINIILTSMAAFVMSRKDFYWNKYITVMVIITMFFGGGLIPAYLLVKGMNMMNTIWAIVLPGAISAYNLIIMRTNFAGIPVSLEESAKLDGANDFVILFKIILPLSMPVIAVMILYYGVGHWNSWFSAMIYLRNAKMFPLQLILRDILINNSTDAMTAGAGAVEKDAVGETIKYATIIVATLPILLAYPSLQKYFVKGVMIGAIKG